MIPGYIDRPCLVVCQLLCHWILAFELPRLADRCDAGGEQTNRRARFRAAYLQRARLRVFTFSGFWSSNIELRAACKSSSHLLRLVFHGNHPGNHQLYVKHKAEAWQSR